MALRGRGIGGALLIASVGLGGASPTLAAGADGAPAPETPGAWGTVAPTYLIVGNSELSPRTTAIGVGCIQNCQLRYATSVVPDQFIAPIHVPSGALLTYLELDYYDGTSVGQAWATLAVCDGTTENCQGFAGPCSNGALVCSGDPDANGFSFDYEGLGSYGIVIDNAEHRYILTAGNSTADGTTAISQVMIGYVRQVSPAPPTATFADVPTSHPFFQFVEALVASGVTSGCGNGNYCPNAPLTRGQMAVFLAKALGLQWN